MPVDVPRSPHVVVGVSETLSVVVVDGVGRFGNRPRGSGTAAHPLGGPHPAVTHDPRTIGHASLAFAALDDALEQRGRADAARIAVHPHRPIAKAKPSDVVAADLDSEISRYVADFLAGIDLYLAMLVDKQDSGHLRAVLFHPGLRVNQHPQP